jgi:GH43 family beta-xylosidase
MFTIGGGITQTPARAKIATFQNPLATGADPWVVRHGGFYYWCLSENDLGVAVYRSRSLTTLGEKFIVWRAPERGLYSAQVWAPELHRLDGRWYIYVAASNGRNETHRMIALESPGDDPTQPFSFKAELYTGDDFATYRKNRWAIDGTILELGAKRYFLWSGWADHRDEQWLYIAPMANPWTLSGPRVRLCGNDQHVWERVGESIAERGLNEAPQVLQRNGRTFVVYSCSGSWEPTYKLARLELTPGANPLSPAAWQKHCEPVFMPTAEACGVGHCSFTRSPDGTEDWIVYHAKVSAAHGWDRRIYAQPFRWDAAGLPDFGVPCGAGVLVSPSREVAVANPAWDKVGALIQNIDVIDPTGKTGRRSVGAQS